MQKSVARPLIMDYLKSLTDDTGIFQHTKFGIPDRSHGYTSDDNARALIAAVMLYNSSKDQGTLGLIRTYLAFIYHAQNEDGSFRNFMGYNREFLENTGSEDCLGRCMWALGHTLAEPAIPQNLRNTCRYMINQALPRMRELGSPRAIAYALIGLTTMLESAEALSYGLPYSNKEDEDPAFLPRAEIAAIIEELALRLHKQYESNKGTGWHWFENSITYGNAMLPWAMLQASAVSHTEMFRQTAKESLDFLAAATFSKDGYYKPIGSHGWLERGGAAALFDEQPIEACEMLLACMSAYKRFGNHTYLVYASTCYEWFHGRNSLSVSLIDEQTGACYDGIHATGINLNQGSENIVSYCIAHMVMQNE